MELISKVKLGRGCLFTSIFALSLLSGCTYFYDGTPAVAKFEPPPEYKFKSITHWKIVADDLSSRVVNVLNPPVKVVAPNGSVEMVAPKPSFDKPIFISVASTSKFGKVFSSQLKSSFLEKGIPVSASREGALILNFKVDVVTQSPIESSGYVPGTLTAVAGGVLVASDIAKYSASPYPGVLGAAALVDAVALFREMNKRPHSEIAVTTTALEGSNYLIHTTDTYYIDTPDIGLYAGSYPQIEQSSSSSSGSSKYLPSKNLNVVGN